MTGHASARAPFVLALVGGEGRASDQRAAKLAAVLDDIIRRLRKLLPNSSFEFITTGDGDDTRLAARLFAKANIRGWAPPNHLLEPSAQTLPEGFCGLSAHQHDAVCAVRSVCRYAHMLIDVAPLTAADDGIRSAVLKAWAERTFEYGDDNADDEQLALLEEPFNGAVLKVVIPSEDSAKFRPRRAWRLSWGDAAADREGLRALSRFDALNSALRHASPRVAKQRSDKFLPPEKLRQAGVREGEDPAFDAVRVMFGFASSEARAAKRMIDRFNYIYALTPPLAVVGYEMQKLLSPDSPNAALWIYVAVFGAFLAIASALAARGDHMRLLELRVTAELLRAQVFWRLAGVDARLETSVRRWLPGASPAIEAAARSIDFMMARQGAPSRTFVDFVEVTWIPSQAEWHLSTSKQHRRDAKRLEALQVTAFVVAFLSAVVLLLVGPAGGQMGLRHVAESIAIASLPAIAGGLAILRERFSYQALSDNYLRMHKLAVSAGKKLAKTSDEREKRRLIEQFGRETIRESIEWMLTHRLRRIDWRGI